MKHNYLLLDALAIFIRESLVPKKRAQSTIDNLTYVMKRLSRYMEEAEGKAPLLYNITFDTIEGYLKHYDGKCNPVRCIIVARGKGHNTNVSKDTYDTELSYLKTFFRWLAANHYIPQDYTLSFEPYSVEDQRVHEKQFVTAEQSLKAREIARAYYPVVGAIFEFEWHSALRASSLRSMRIRHYRPWDNKVHPYGTYQYVNEKKKGDVTVTRPIDSRMAVFMAEYLEWYRQEAIKYGYIGADEKLPGDWYMFPSWRGTGKVAKGVKKTGKKIHPDYPLKAIYAVVKRIHEETGIYEPGNAIHGHRRGTADEAFETGGIGAAQTLLDHANEDTTRAYLNRQRMLQKLAEVNEKRFAQKPEPTPTEQDNTPTNVVSLMPRLNAR